MAIYRTDDDTTGTVGVVGSSTPKPAPTTPTIPATTTEWNGVDSLCEACKRGEHPACSGYATTGDTCECECKVADQT